MVTIRLPNQAASWSRLILEWVIEQKRHWWCEIDFKFVPKFIIDYNWWSLVYQCWLIMIIIVILFTKDLCNEEYIVSIRSSSAITFIAVINLDGWPLEKLYLNLYVGSFSINDHY